MSSSDPIPRVPTLIGFEPLGVGPYTRHQVFDGHEKDPINVAYVGGITLKQVFDLTVELGLRETFGVGDQVFPEPRPARTFHRQDFNQATAIVSGPGGRFHTRIYELVDDHPQFGRVVVSPIHRETWAMCGLLPGDAVPRHGFDIARDWIVSQLSGVFAVAYLRLPYFKPVLQCNSEPVGTDGYCAIIAEPGFFDSWSVRHDLATPDRLEIRLSAVTTTPVGGRVVTWVA